jgi:spore germination protein
VTRPRRRTVLAGAVAVALAVAAGLIVLRPLMATEPGLAVAATYPWWDPRGEASLHTALSGDVVSEVSPVWANPTADGGLRLTPADAAAELVRREDAVLLPTVQNYVDRQWQGELVAGILQDRQTAQRHRRLLVELVLEHDWAGIDVDYGNLPPTAGPMYVQFLTELRDQLHAHRKQLVVTVPARVSEEERAETLAYSYQTLGELADQLRLRAHYHAWDTSPPGPVAPLPWVEDVVDYAVERVPRDKLVLGLATYGFDWAGGPGLELQTADARALARAVGAQPQWHASAAAYTFSYLRDGVEHTVWFEDARSARAKYAIAERERLRGVTVWRLGGEDPRLWDMTRTTGGGA